MSEYDENRPVLEIPAADGRENLETDTNVVLKDGSEQEQIRMEMRTEDLQGSVDEGNPIFRSEDLPEQVNQEKQEEPPLVVDLSGISTGAEVPENMSKFQHINTGFFAQTKEAALTVNGKIVTVNAAAVRLFPEVEYMEILISPEDKKVAFQPSDEMNVRAYKWAREKDGKRYSTQRTGLPFVLCVCQIMGWDYNKRYKILGKKVPSDTGEEILLFDLTAAGKGIGKPGAGEKGGGRATILTGWDGTFGPVYGEGGGSLRMDKFDKYTVFSIKEGWAQDPGIPTGTAQSAGAPSDAGDES